MLELNITNWLLAFLPLFLLLVTMVGLKWSAPKAGILAWVVAGFCGWLFFGADGFLLAVACGKGLSLSLFVLLVIWSAVFLYNLIEQLGAIGVIGNSIARLAGSRLGQALLLGWAFSGFMQGIAGFGVPVAVIAPLMLMLGFSPVIAAVSVLVGHSWAVTFGSMGSSYYTIQLVTGIPGPTIGPVMAILFALPIIATGFCVAHIEGGWQSVRKGAAAVLIVGLVMSFFVWLMTFLGAAQIASVVPGLVGCSIIWLLCKTPLLNGEPNQDSAQRPTGQEHELSFHLAFLPYYLLIFLTALSQLP
ncbi:MAG: L-lactate permease, partial [Gammaproteobacteria bacterium]|nr:L-lactate permease [Gammaproteobacteria bacterium]